MEIPQTAEIEVYRRLITAACKVEAIEALPETSEYHKETDEGYNSVIETLVHGGMSIVRERFLDHDREKTRKVYLESRSSTYTEAMIDKVVPTPDPELLKWYMARIREQDTRPKGRTTKEFQSCQVSAKSVELEFPYVRLI